jgi:hypothetical protein
VTRARRRVPAAHLAAGVLLGACVLTRADLILVPFLCAAIVALGAWRRGALVAGGALLVLAPWTGYASSREGSLVPVTTGGGSALFVGTYLPGDGHTVGMKRALGEAARRRDPRLRGVPDFELPAQSVLAVVAARRPELPFEEAVAREGRENLVRYGLRRPVAFAGMMLEKGVVRMWSRYARGGARHTSWAIRAWHVVLVLGALAGQVAGLLARRDRTLAAILATVLCATAIHMVVVAQARYNLPLMPALLAGGAAGWFLRYQTSPSRQSQVSSPARSSVAVSGST